MASEVRADSEVAEDVAGIVDESDEGAGTSGGSGPDSPAESAETENAETENAQSAEVAGADVTAEAPRRKRRIGIVLLFAALALIIDVTSKAIVVAQMQDRGPVHVPGGFLNITLIRNSGAAFSIGEGQTWVFTIIAAAVVFVILRVSRNLRSLPWAIALGLLLGGALGNLSDRLFRSPGVGRGDVVDFLQFPTFPLVHYDFPVFNLADSSIVVGGCLMVLLSFLGMQPDGTRHKDVKDGDDAAG
ncbi:signal peptidase II [Catenulispora sp. GP43]|uniref:signal peptidase II n=1 Tax=Catenulispora sp. GP43 TaxID=3156263 RepID=UPI0035157D84